MTKKILGAAIGSCVHVSGIHHFLALAQSEGFDTISLGPAVSIERIIIAIKEYDPDIVAISYRLTPESSKNLFSTLETSLSREELKEIRLIFGGTPPVAEIARESGLFEKVFNGTEPLNEIKRYLRGTSNNEEQSSNLGTLLERINKKYPYPILRHHFGRPTLQETIEGIKIIAEAEVVDVISIGPDQNAQEYFFEPSKMDHHQDGAGGVPLRKAADLEMLYQVSRTGNFPLLRCYAGTRDLIKWAEMSVKTINNAWAAIPLCWYSVIDGRSNRPLDVAIRENQLVMKWYAEQGIPVEVNESHQWSLRDAHDSLAVTMAFLAAYNAKKMGVNHYISQFMFNTPPGTFPSMDIAKMMAKRELIEELAGPDFEVIREVRAGIAHFSPVPAIAQGQLASSAVISLALDPHILHVVGFSEGDHATYPEELINSCNIIHGVLANCLKGLPDLTLDESVKVRKEELKSEARILISSIQQFGINESDDPLSDPLIIAEAIKEGLLDAPHFRGNKHLFGQITTRLINGGWYAINPETGNPISEIERSDSFFKRIKVK